MSEQDEPYTPSVEQVREDWISFVITPGDYWDALSEEEAQTRFDRMIARVRREAAAEQREIDAQIAESVVVRTSYSARTDVAAAIREQRSDA